MRNVINIRSSNNIANRQILEQLYQNHGEALRCFLLGRVSSETDIEDIVQDVFVRLARRDNLINRSDEGFKKNRAYIFTAANNLVVDMERKRQVRWKYSNEKKRQADNSNIDELEPAIVIAAQEHMSLLKEAIKSLKLEWRTAFILSRFKSMSHKDISQVMGITYRQAEGFIAKATLKLHKTLNEIYQTNEKQTGDK